MKTDINEKEIVIALAGNPNSGKTTVFNALTGSHQHVGNWPGVTVERKEGVVKKNDRTFRVVDLPGIYSLSAYSHEEIVSRDFLIDENVDVIINVIDAGNLERNLYLTTQLLELGIPTVIALNMVDMAARSGYKINVEKFADFLGVQVISTVASKGEGMDKLLAKAAEAAIRTHYDPPRSARHSPEIEHELTKLEQKLALSSNCAIPIRWMLLKALEDDRETMKRLLQCTPNPDVVRNTIDGTRKHIEQVVGGDIEGAIADGRYGFIGGLLREVVTKTSTVDRLDITQHIDDLLLHRILGIPIFLGLMWLTFTLTFNVGGIFAGLIEDGVHAVASWAAAELPSGPIASLITRGIIPGVGGVLVFLPNIAVMFMIISFLEDSGYMARAAFLMDKSMHKFGLHGKSFIPMLMGFGCNVPAVMATRALDTVEDRLLTILITPLMSCTARLPIYILFTGVFFSKHGAMVIFSIYAIGVLLAVISGKLFRKLLFPKAVSPFVMELPPYRLPTLRGTLIHVWERTSLFLTKAGTVILAAAVVIWALGSLPFGHDFASSNTLVGHLGRFMEPLVRPLGMDWRAAVALFFGLGAKEIVVSTLGVLYGFTDVTHGSNGIANAFTPLTAYVFMVVSLIYVPCVATIAAVRRETNSWKWTLMSVCYSLILSYAMGLAVYHIGQALGFQ